MTNFNRRFWLSLLFQFFIIFSLFLPTTLIKVSGKTVVLQTLPFNFNDYLLQGYFQGLRYEISEVESIKNLTWQAPEGGKWKNLTQGQKLYIILEAPKQSEQKPPLPWTPIAVSLEMPKDLPETQAALQGRYQDDQIKYEDIERFNLPEDKLEEIEKQIKTSLSLQTKDSPLRVTIKVDNQGKAVPISLWVGDKSYSY